MDSLPECLAPLTAAMADEIAERLLPEHAREIRELSGMAPAAALRLSLAASLLAYAALDGDGRPFFLIGAEPAGLVTGDAQVWMVGTPAMAARARTTLRCARWGLRRAFLATGAGRLEQRIPEWYATGLRFAGRLGFRPGAAGTGVDGAAHVVLPRSSIIGIDGKGNAWEYPRSAMS